MAKSIDDVREQAHQEFLRESAGLHVDVSGLPSIRDRQRADTEKKPEPQFSQPYNAGYSAKRNALPRALAAMANKISSDPRDPYRDDVVRALGFPSETEGTGECHFRVADTGESVVLNIQRTSDGNWCASYDGKRHVAEDRDTLLAGISRAINNDRRGITDDQKRGIYMVCNSGGQGFYRGVAKYVSARTGIPEDEVLADSTLLNSRNAAAFDEAILFCWFAIRADFSPPANWEEFVRAHAQGRSLNIAMLDAARSAWERQAESAAREALLSTISDAPPAEPPTYRELDQLGDDELARQLHGVKREYTRLVKAGLA